jgi:WD40 repeat protein
VPPAPPDDERDPLERLADEFLRRRRAGEAVDPEAFAAEHPEHAAEIRSLFPVLLPLEAWKPTPARPRERIGPWSVVRELGRGGMGVVYLAEDEATGARAALKLVSSDQPEALGRFRREAEALARVTHPGICRAIAVAPEGAKPWIAMEYLEGATLADAIRRDRGETGEPRTRPGDFTRWLGVGVEVARALHAAHEAGLVHRDVKPGNVMLTTDGRAVVLDFGLAHAAADAERTRLTHTGVPIGTPAYMSPEQVRAGAEPVDRRTDVYSLGATLYEALTLEPPFSGPTIATLFSRILTTDPEPARRLNPALSADVEAVLSTAMEKNPARRYATARDLAEDLERAREGRRVRARRAGPARRLATWAGRHPGIAAVVGSTALALATGLVVALVFLARVSEARDREAAIALRARARVLAAAAAEAERADASLALLLAQEAVRTARLPETVTQLHAAVAASLEVARLEGHGAAVSSLSWDARGERVATGCADGHGRLFDRDGTLRLVVPPEGSPVRGHVHVALSPDGTRLLARSSDGAVWLVADDGTPLADLAHPARPAHHALWLADGTACVVGAQGWLAFHEQDGAMRTVVDVPSEDGGSGVVHSAAVSRDPPLLHVLTGDLVAIAYDAEGREVGRREEARGARIARVLDGGRLAWLVPREGPAVPNDPAAERLSVVGRDGAPLGSLLGLYPQNSVLQATEGWWFAWSPVSGATVVEAQGPLARVRLLDLQRSEVPGVAAASADGGRLFTSRGHLGMGPPEGLSTPPLRLWTPGGAPVASLAAGSDRPSEAAFSPDGGLLVLARHTAGPATVHRTTPVELATEVPRWSGEGYRHPPLLTADGSHMVAFANERLLRVLRDDGTVRSEIALDEGLLHASLDPHRGLLLAAGRDGTVRVLDLGGVVSLDLPPTPGLQRAMWVGGDGGFVTVVGGRTRFHAPDGSVRAEVEGAVLSAEPLRTHAGRVAVGSAERVRVCAPDGAVLLEVPVGPGERPFWWHGTAAGPAILCVDSGVVQASARYLDASGKTVWEQPLGGVGHRLATLTPDGKRALLSASGGLSLRDAAGREVAHLRLPGGVAHHVVDREGRRFAAVSSSGAIRLWDLEGRLLLDLPNQGGPAFLGFSEDGRRIASVTGAMARLYTTDVDELVRIAAERTTRGFTDVERARYAELLEPAR